MKIHVTYYNSQPFKMNIYYFNDISKLKNILLLPFLHVIQRLLPDLIF